MGRDLRKYARQTNLRLVFGFVFILFLIGDGLIYLFYGRSAAITGFFCLLAGLAPILMILIAFWIINLILKANK